jgi:hypothetical protein
LFRFERQCLIVPNTEHQGNVCIIALTSAHIAWLTPPDAGQASVDSTLAVCVLVLHVLFILWVIFGAFLVGSHPILRWLHIVSLIWGVLVEVLYWPCPLTLLENWFEQKAGVEPYQGGFLLHYLDKLVYPDIPAFVLMSAAVVVCGFNIAYYLRLIWISHLRRSAKDGTLRKI